MCKHGVHAASVGGPQGCLSSKGMAMGLVMVLETLIFHLDLPLALINLGLCRGLEEQVAQPFPDVL